MSPNPSLITIMYIGTSRTAIIRNNPKPPNPLAFNLNLVINDHFGKLDVINSVPSIGILYVVVIVHNPDLPVCVPPA